MTMTEQEPAFEYMAQAASLFINGEAKLVISEKALAITTLFDAVEIPFSEMNELRLANYAVTIRADSGDYILSRMGSWCDPFYAALCDAYNKAVLRSLFISGKPTITARGEYRYTELNKASSGEAPVHVYENNMTFLPPNIGARRVPLCFVSSMETGSFELTLRLNTGESYTCAKLGFDTAPLEAAIEKHLRTLREKTLAAVKDIDPSLATTPASQLAKLMPEGAAAPIGQLATIAPSFAAALEGKIATTRAASSYAMFKEMCDPAQIWVGFRKNEGTRGSAVDSDEDPDAVVDPYLLWLIAPSPDGQCAVVEFAEANSASFVYRTGGDFFAFARQLNRALEAINFKREVIRLSDEELRKPENVDYFMAAKRTTALQFIRANFLGRIIHSSPESWKRNLLNYFKG